MKTKEEYEKEIKMIKEKAITLLEIQPANLQRMQGYMLRISYLNGIVKGMKTKDEKI